MENTTIQPEKKVYQSILTIGKKTKAVSNENLNKDRLDSLREYDRMDNEVEAFRKLKKRGDLLERLYSSFMYIRPATVEGERLFSTTNILLSKERNRMGDEPFDSIIFLKFYFKDNKFT